MPDEKKPTASEPAKQTEADVLPSALEGISFLSMNHKWDENEADDTQEEKKDIKGNAGDPPTISAEGDDSEETDASESESSQEDYSPTALLAVVQQDLADARKEREEERRQWQAQLQQQRQQEQKPPPSPFALKEGDDPDEYITRKQMADHIEQLHQFHQAQVNTVWGAQVNAEVNRMTAAYERQCKDKPDFAAKYPRQELETRIQAYRQEPLKYGFGIPWQGAFQEIYSQRSVPDKDKKIADLEKQLANLKGDKGRTEQEKNKAIGKMGTPTQSRQAPQQSNVLPGKPQEYKKLRPAIFSMSRER